MNCSFKVEKQGIFALFLLLAVFAIVFFWRMVDEEVPGDYHVRKGNYRLEDGQYELALEEFSRALGKTPNHPMAHLGIALTSMQLNRNDDALAAFNRVIAIDPENAVAHADLGIFYDRLGQHEKALASYQEAIRRDQEVLGGPGWMWRFLHNVPEKPPSIAQRAAYLEEELQKPLEEQLLLFPEKDQEQRMYKVD